MVLLAACSSPTDREAVEELNRVEPFATPEPTDHAVLASFAPPPATHYRLAPGDIIFVEVWGQPTLSGPHTIGPDGAITVASVGTLTCRGMTREQAAAAIEDALQPYYRSVAVTVRVDQYLGNQVSVLGMVNAPGAYTFEGQPTLLGALAKAGGLTAVTARSGRVNTRVSISRKDELVWIDTRELLAGGNPGLNIPLAPGDYVTVQDTADELVYVLGEVRVPGPYPLTPNMKLTDLVTIARGMTEDAQPRKLQLLRPTMGLDARINYREMLEEEQFDLNVDMQAGDILYVPRSGLARFAYVLRSISPFSTVFQVTATD